jgi:hypothetical protein
MDLTFYKCQNYAYSIRSKINNCFDYARNCSKETNNANDQNSTLKTQNRNYII